MPQHQNEAATHALSADELEAEAAALLPAPEAMTLIDTSVAGGPLPVEHDPTTPAETLPGDQPAPTGTPIPSGTSLPGDTKLPLTNPLVG